MPFSSKFFISLLPVIIFVGCGITEDFNCNSLPYGRCFTDEEIASGMTYGDGYISNNFQSEENIVIIGYKNDPYTGTNRLLAQLPKKCRTTIRRECYRQNIDPEIQYNYKSGTFILFVDVNLSDWYFIDHAYNSLGQYYGDISYDRQVISGDFLKERLRLNLSPSLVRQMSEQFISFSFRGDRGSVEYQFQPKYLRLVLEQLRGVTL